jgi:hypothetical protein
VQIAFRVADNHAATERNGSAQAAKAQALGVPGDLATGAA